jgi:hypothetical protein
MHAILRAAVVAAALLAAPLGRAASTTNFSDQWWVPTESGWGASVLQQRDILFIDLFVYGADGRPTWFTAAATLQPSPGGGRVLFIGDLYQTSGPYFGSPFSASSVGTRRVGTLTFDADSTDAAALAYTVDGVTVTKNVTRQLWAYEDFSGAYSGGLAYQLSQCANPASNGPVEELGAVQITQTGNTSFTMVTQSPGGSCTWNATYAQAGHMGNATGTFSCANGVAGSFTAFELERALGGFTGRIVGVDQFCHFDGRIGGVRR